MAHKYGQAAKKKIKKIMREFGQGKPTSSKAGKKVTSRKQTIATALSEARSAGVKTPKKSEVSTITKKKATSQKKTTTKKTVAKKSTGTKTTRKATDARSTAKKTAAKKTTKKTTAAKKNAATKK